MPPAVKFDASSPDNAAEISLLASFGLPKSIAIDSVRNPHTRSRFPAIVSWFAAHGQEAVPEKFAKLLLGPAESGLDLKSEGMEQVLSRIQSGELASLTQVSAAIKFITANGPVTPASEEAFKTECGIGFSISLSALHALLDEILPASETKSWSDFNAAFKVVAKADAVKWVPPKQVKESAEAVWAERYGPKVSAQPAAPKAAKPASAAPAAKPKSEPETAPTSISICGVDALSPHLFDRGFLGSLQAPGTHAQLIPLNATKHLAATGSQVWTRFPPEPNGYLHIGHSKAISVNFGYAAYHNGRCYLRYDDTNPEAEEQKYFDSILQMVRWLGFEPWKITYSSDYFEQLYECARQLIMKGRAYVCHQTKEEIQLSRGGKEHGERTPSPYRNRPIQESLDLFEKMKNGEFERNSVTLRMKQDLSNGNPYMWDVVAYRVLDKPHHRTGDKWKIYPTYDFTHCLCDSFENISHSLCTTEFELARESYDWLCNQLEVYRPQQSEYGRLNITGTIMSKRRIKLLVTDGHVQGWDDPRLYTLLALRRRGVPPGAILSFINGLGIGVGLAYISVSRFEQSVRQFLESAAPRLMMVLKPIKVTIINLPPNHLEWVEVPLHPKIPSMGSSRIPFTNTIYIDADDFRAEDSKDYYRLAPGKSVGLFHAPYSITYVSHTLDESDNVNHIICELQTPPKDAPAGWKAPKTKAYIQWVAEHEESGSPVKIHEARIYNQLFKSDVPESHESGNFLNDINPNSMEVCPTALVDIGFWKFAKDSYTFAKKDAEERTRTASAKMTTPANDGLPAPPRENELRAPAPKLNANQLIGKECIRFQGLRVAYFAVDQDSVLGCLDESADVAPGYKKGDSLIVNRIVSLKEDSAK